MHPTGVKIRRDAFTNLGEHVFLHGSRPSFKVQTYLMFSRWKKIGQKIRILSSIAQDTRCQCIELARSSRKLFRATGLPRTLLGSAFMMFSQT